MVRRRTLAQEPVPKPPEPVVALPPTQPERMPWTLHSTKAALAEPDPLLDRLDAEIDVALARAQGLFVDPSE